MSDQKVHPSEYLEFVSVSPSQPTFSSETISKPPKTTQHGEEKDVELVVAEPVVSLDLPPMGRDALQANQSEHTMSFRRALKMYPKAIAWSAVISLAIIMEGYDTALIGSFYAFPEFRLKYGTIDDQGMHEVSTKWQASLSNGAAAGGILGLFVNGILTERFGYRRTMIGALLMLAAFVSLSFFAFNIQTLLAGQILCGIPWGIFSTLTTTYAIEVMPLQLRGYLTSNVNMCWVLGQTTAYGILRALLNMNSNWSFRIPFGLQWVWIVIILTIAYFAPESPWWLIRKGYREQAKTVLLRLTRRNQGFNADNAVAIMEHTNLIEKQLDINTPSTEESSKLSKRFGDLSYAQCFRGSNLRRTEIACMLFMTQNMCGLPIIGFAAYFYRQIGFDGARSFDLTLGMHGLAILGGFISLALLKYVGQRRLLYLIGLCICFVILLAIGILGCLHETKATLWSTAALLVFFIFVFDITVGPLTYCLIAELPSTRLRVKTVVLARVAYNINSMITNLLITRCLNPFAWNLRGKSAFLCAGTCAFCIVYCYFRLPETRGLNFHELDILFEKGADARKFKKFQQILEGNGYFSFYETSEQEGQAGQDGRKSNRASTATEVGWRGY